MSKIDITKTYKTRDGMEVNLLMVDGGGEYPVVGAINFGSNGWNAHEWDDNGRFIGPCKTHGNDLIEAKHDRFVWVNIYPCTVGYCDYPTRTDADSMAAPGRVACIKLNLTELEGRFDD